jgi:hypothetical protein
MPSRLATPDAPIPSSSSRLTSSALMLLGRPLYTPRSLAALMPSIWLVDDVLEVSERPREAVDACHDEGVAGPEEGYERLQLGAAIAARAGLLLTADHGAAGGRQGGLLKTQILIRRGYAGVAVQVWSGVGVRGLLRLLAGALRHALPPNVSFAS